MLLLPAASMLLEAQSQRLVLFEEMSNASCGPCAAQNPTYHAYVSQQVDRVIPISWRSSYPGRDVMNAENTTMHNGRVSFYGTPGVPHLRINGGTAPPSPGWYDGGAGDTAAQSVKLAATPAMSPVTITVQEMRDGMNSTVTVNVSSIEPIANKVLHIAVVEAHHNYASAGSNGEKDFYNVGRKLLPTNDGTSISLATSETRTVTESYTIDEAKWNANQVYVVAFLQDPDTKEVLQVATSQFMPKVKLSFDGATVAKKSEATPQAWAGTFRSSLTGEYTVNIDQRLAQGWTGTVMVNGAAVKHGDKVTIERETNIPVEATITPDAGRAGMGRIHVELTNGHQHVERSFNLFSGQAEVGLLVRDEGNVEISNKYYDGLTAGSRSFVILDKESEPLFNLRDFQVVGMEVGKGILYESDVQLLKSYIDGGGRLFLAGAEIAWGLVDPAAATNGYYSDESFVNEYLHADYLGDGTSTLTTVIGTADDIIADGMNIKINNGSIKNQDTPDQIDPLGGAVRIFRYNDESGAGLRYADESFRLVYLGFGLEGIGTAAQRTQLLDRSIAWLMGSLSADASDELLGATVATTPNPASGMVEVPFTLPISTRAQFQLFDMRGALVATIAEGSFEAGASSVRFDASGYANGAYALVMVTPHGRVTTKVTIAH